MGKLCPYLLADHELSSLSVLPGLYYNHEKVLLGSFVPWLPFGMSREVRANTDEKSLGSLGRRRFSRTSCVLSS